MTMEYKAVTERIPADGAELIRKLNAAGYEAWFVGGCVRDCLLGIQPHDWDICTNALPEQTKECLCEYRIYDTGIKHGTVLAATESSSYEITTFRTETGYSDHRHPDRVVFVSDLETDLARRDFTMNAMAFHPEFGIRDPFNGEKDLTDGRLCAVGNAEQRFGEDALRILRCLRFASRFGFAIEKHTAEAVRGCRGDLNEIAVERIFTELKGILCGPYAKQVLMGYPEVFGQILPEMVPMIGYDQKNSHHAYDLWEHTACTVDNVPADPALRLAALLHDIGKPETQSTGEDGQSHFYGHDRAGAELADRVLLRLKSDTMTRQRVTALIKLHDRMLPQSLPKVRRLAAEYGEALLRELLVLRKADALATGTADPELVKMRDADFEQLLNQTCEEGECRKIGDLEIKGSDLIRMGVPEGPAVGQLLQAMLDAVMDGVLENKKDDLTMYAKTHFQQ